MRRFVIGDIHGAHKALVQVLKRADFDYHNDMLISLGDVADGWPQVYECFEELFKIDNLVYVLGNHDEWLLDFLKHGSMPHVWVSQGGLASMQSYNTHGVPEDHIRFLEKAHLLWYTDANDKLFVHAGINPQLSIFEQSRETLLWDRKLHNVARRINFPGMKVTGTWDEIYIGHTSIFSWSDHPVCKGGVWMMDTGAGWHGVLSVMDIDTKEYWQSDITSSFYPNEAGRR